MEEPDRLPVDRGAADLRLLAAWQVYADWLAENADPDDPHPALITAMLSGAHAHTRTLLQTHRDGLFGTLSAFSTRRLEPEEALCRFLPDWTHPREGTPTSGWAQLEWCAGVVRRLAVMVRTPSDLQAALAFVHHPSARRLEMLVLDPSYDPIEVFEQLDAAPPAPWVRSVCVFRSDPGPVQKAFPSAALLEPGGFEPLSLRREHPPPGGPQASEFSPRRITRRVVRRTRRLLPEDP